MISLNELTFYYDNKKTIINKATYTFRCNYRYLITGENGSGKTTLIKIILGLTKPKSGYVNFNKKLIFSYLPDFNGIYEDLTLKDNVIFRLALYNESFKDKVNIYNDYIQKYNFIHHSTLLVKEMSLGMKKKVALICALIVDADVYIFDEPTGGLDATSKATIIEMLNDFNLINKIIIVISHDESMLKSFDSIKVNLINGELK